jgi:hypothetical protein
MKLRDEPCRSFNGACQELREEGNIECIKPQVFLRDLIPPVDIDRITHILEYVKRNANRQKPVQGGNVKRIIILSKEGGQGLGEKIVILEYKQKNDIRKQGDDKISLSSRPISTSAHAQSRIIVDER